MKTSLRLFVFTMCFCLFFCISHAEKELPFPDPSKPISMDFQDASLKDILKIFSIQSGLNFIASEAVQDKTITLYLDRVPVKETMDKLFKANNLIYELDEKANIITVKGSYAPVVETVTRVYYLKYATVSSSNFKIETHSSSGGSSGSSAAASGNDIIAAIRGILTSNGKLTEDARTNSIVVTDIPGNFPGIEQLINSLDVAIPSVLIEVEMLDVKKDLIDVLGFEYGNNNTPLTLLLPNAHFNETAKFFLGRKKFRGIDSFSDTNAEGAVVFGNIFGELLDFLRTQTDTKFLARPRLLTLNNETAEISITKDEVVGREDTTTTTSGVTVTTSVFKRSTDLALTAEGTGIFLKVTPQINLEKEEVTMVINPKSSVTSTSALSTSSNTQSDVELRSTKSIVKVKDGETIVLGGLIHNDKQVVVKKLPFLGDIPFFGALFRHKNQSKDTERELIIFITPRIVKDSNTAPGQRMAVMPTREQDIPSAFERQARIGASLNNFDKIKMK